VARARARRRIDIAALAAARRTEIHRDVAALLRRHDVLALPATPVAAPPVDDEWVREIDGVEHHRYFEWQRCANRVTVAAHPALVTPAGFTVAGLPVGIQLVGRHRRDRKLLAVGAVLEDALGLVRLSPPL
jgi:amidase